MKNLEYSEIELNKINLIKPLWKKLNIHHKERSKYFSDYYSKFSFKKRIKNLTKKLKKGKIRIETVKDTNKNIYIGYCISIITEENEGEIESILIEKDYRGYKIGDNLMKNSLKWMDFNKVKTKKIIVAYGNEEVFPFYEKYGFYPRC